MKTVDGIGLSDVQAVYGGPEGRLWELVMGEQIHIGGFESSGVLAARAEIAPGTRGVDLCCCNGAGMRLLFSARNVAGMTGVDATETVIEQGRRRCRAEGLEGRVRFVQADACDTHLPAGAADFVWGEDAWCYVVDKPRLISEAARLLKPGGTVAFTDWIEGRGLSDPEAERYMRFMKFPSILDLAEYRGLLERNGCQVLVAEDTGRFARYVDLYVNMISMQLTYDALKILGFDSPTLQSLGEEMAFMQSLAHEGKIAQGMLVARKQ